MQSQKANAVLIRFSEAVTRFEQELIAAATAEGADKDAVAEILRRACALKTEMKKAAGGKKNTYA